MHVKEVSERVSHEALSFVTVCVQSRCLGKGLPRHWAHTNPLKTEQIVPTHPIFNLSLPPKL